MNRRNFFRRTVGAAGAVVLAPFVPVAAKPQSLLFHPEAFALVMRDLAPPMHTVNRMDILYGCGTITPDRMCRVENRSS